MTSVSATRAMRRPKMIRMMMWRCQVTDPMNSLNRPMMKCVSIGGEKHSLMMRMKIGDWLEIDQGQMDANLAGGLGESRGLDPLWALDFDVAGSDRWVICLTTDSMRLI